MEDKEQQKMKTFLTSLPLAGAGPADSNPKQQTIVERPKALALAYSTCESCHNH
jgi:hypothetical protein